MLSFLLVIMDRGYFREGNILGVRVATVGKDDTRTVTATMGVAAEPEIELDTAKE